MAVEVRPARPDELDEVGRITVAGYRADGMLVEDDFYEPVLADAASRARDAELLVAVDGDELLATVTFCTAGSPYSEVAHDNEGEFRMLSTAPAARRRGAARALVEHCIARSRELGYDAIVLCSLAEMAAAHQLYAALGFARLPDRDWTPAPGVDLLAFRLPLR